MDDLRRMGDPIPIARHRAETVVHRDAWIPEMLNLLQHGIGQAVYISVARQQQDGQAIGMRNTRSGDHIRGTWPDR